MEKLGEGLAELHKTTSGSFGWTSSNYIGSLVQQNEHTSLWAEFYATQRIMPLVEKLYDNASFSKAEITAAENLCKSLPSFFPDEKPSLLHGDLWDGNIMPVAVSNGVVPSVYDPAVYYGHREMDIGMKLLFGGINSSFLHAYNYYFSLEKGWKSRVALTQLYPLLVHAVLFGGGYVQQCRETIKAYNDY